MPEESNSTDPEEPLPLDVAGIVLAGGKSTRYGQNKAFVELGGVRLIERVVAVLGRVFQSVYIMTNNPEDYAYLKLPMHRDIIEGLGPLGGIYTALRLIPQSTGFFTACDMPYLNARLIRHMAGHRHDYDAVVPIISGKMEALHAVYGKGCLPAVQRLIKSGSYQVFRFFPEVSVRYVGEEEIRRYDPWMKCFFNINRPGDLHRGDEEPTTG
jgi:molybdopterin-guanine dinucleotide biosynthesis protein A